MKNEVILFCMLFILVNISFVNADTTFFEGDYGYRDDFIMESVPEVVVVGELNLCGNGFCDLGENSENCPEDCGVQGGRGIVYINKELVCDICLESLQEHINDFRHIDYSDENLELLTLQINEETNANFLKEQVRALVENFDDECGIPYPLLSGFAGGRYRDIVTPLVLAIGIIVLGFFIFLYFIFRRLKKVRFKRKSKRKK